MSIVDLDSTYETILRTTWCKGCHRKLGKDDLNPPEPFYDYDRRTYKMVFLCKCGHTMLAEIDPTPHTREEYEE